MTEYVFENALSIDEWMATDKLDTHRIDVLPLRNRIKIQTNGSVSDGYHTMDELYDHRMMLFVALLNCIPRIDLSPFTAWKSRKHSDGSMFEGFFIAGLYIYSHSEKKEIEQISYHLKNEYWDKIKDEVEEYETAPEYDGHTSTDVLKRLEQL